MNCKQFQRLLLQVDDNNSISLEMKEHLEQCSDCQIEYEEFNQTISYLNQLPEVQPTAEFSAAWKNRIRKEVLKPTQEKRGFFSSVVVTFLKPSYMMALSAILLVMVTSFLLNKTTDFSQGSKEIAIKIEDGATYELKIIDVGPRNKYVQKVIRNFRSVSEGGIVFSQREGNENWTSFKGLNPEQVQGLKHDLEYIGAKVVIEKEN